MTTRNATQILQGSQPVRENSILKRSMSKPLGIAHNDNDDSDDDERAVNPLTFFERSGKDESQCSSGSTFSGVKKDGSVIVPNPIKFDASKLLKRVDNPPRVFTSIHDTSSNDDMLSGPLKGVSKIGMVGLKNHIVVKNVKDLAAIQSINNYKKENDNINNMFNRIKTSDVSTGIKTINTMNANEYQMIGKVLVNMNKLNASASAFNNQKTIHDKTANARAIAASDAAKRKRKLEIEELLNRKSAHSEEASDEAFDSFSKKLKSLESRERKSDKENAVTFTHVKAFSCDKCGLLAEECLVMCRQKKHTVNFVKTIKRFFECGNCFRKESTLGENARLPKIKCRCGQFSWNACGKNGSRDGKSSGVGIHNQPLLLASSESVNYSKSASDKAALFSISRKYE